ncbi:hypothetical protein [Rhizobium ruizarguesonis]|uniref:hypothetical protein n=1 Tax=Rhizobium ruizarguesonis TaxID=2081791 RepID=UPI0013EEDD65|nr:hypothetical protein [Rhizobium ruizarguesonis]
MASDANGLSPDQDAARRLIETIDTSPRKPCRKFGHPWENSSREACAAAQQACLGSGNDENAGTWFRQCKSCSISEKRKTHDCLTMRLAAVWAAGGPRHWRSRSRPPWDASDSVKKIEKNDDGIGTPINHDRSHLVTTLLLTFKCQENAETN